MRASLKNPKVGSRVSFEVFTPESKAVVIKNEAQLDAQKWLFE